MKQLKATLANAVLKDGHVPVDILKGAKAKPDRAATDDATKNNKEAIKLRGRADTVVATTINSKGTRKRDRHVGTRKGVVHRIAKVAMVKVVHLLSVDPHKETVIREGATHRVRHKGVVRRAAINRIKRASHSSRSPTNRSRSPMRTTGTSMVVVVASSPTTLPNRHSLAVPPLRATHRRSNDAATTTRTLSRKRVDIRRNVVLLSNGEVPTTRTRHRKRVDTHHNGVLLSDGALATMRAHSRKRADIRRNGGLLAGRRALMAKRGIGNCPVEASAVLGHRSP